MTKVPETGPQPETVEQERKQALITHLAALRNVLVICAGAILAAFLLTFYFAVDRLMDFIMRPIVARGIEVIYTAMSEALVTKLKVALIGGVIVASPVIVWQVWGFLKPALYPNERRTFRVLFFVALLLFLMGIVFCYCAVYTLALDFFLVAGENLATPMLSIDKYVGFLFGFLLPFGLAFELPVALYMTTRMGWTTAETLASKRKFVILAVVAIAAVLTPPDVVSQVMLSIPMLLLYEVSILVARFVKPRERE